MKCTPFYLVPLMRATLTTSVKIDFATYERDGKLLQPSPTPHIIRFFETAEIATAVTTATNSSNVNSISLKMPKFWSQDPKLWFVQVEKQFALINITSSSTKFEHVVANLDNDEAGKVRKMCYY